MISVQCDRSSMLSFDEFHVLWNQLRIWKVSLHVSSSYSFSPIVKLFFSNRADLILRVNFGLFVGVG